MSNNWRDTERIVRFQYVAIASQTGAYWSWILAAQGYCRSMYSLNCTNLTPLYYAFDRWHCRIVMNKKRPPCKMSLFTPWELAVTNLITAEVICVMRCLPRSTRNAMYRSVEFYRPTRHNMVAPWKSTHLRSNDICVSKLNIIGSDNGLWPRQRQDIIWINAGKLSIGPLGTNSEIASEICRFLFREVHLKMSFAKWVAIWSRPQFV